MRTPGNWEKQRINPRIEKFGAEVQPVGTVMFPTSHDITPQFELESLRTIKNLVRKNDVLIVTKPHLSVIETLCNELAEHRGRILFRFTIGSLSPELCKFWEPGAPNPTERVAALEHAYKKGFRTSVSIEPMLDSVEATCELVAVLEPHVTDTIWIGKMQRVPQKLNTHVAGFAAARQKIAEQQADDEILKLVARLGHHGKIRWKDSVKAVLCRYEGR